MVDEVKCGQGHILTLEEIQGKNPPLDYKKFPIPFTHRLLRQELRHPGICNDRLMFHII